MTLSPEYLAFLAKYWPLFTIISACCIVTVGTIVNTFKINMEAKSGQIINMAFRLLSFIYFAFGIIILMFSLAYPLYSQVMHEQITIDQLKTFLMLHTLTAVSLYVLLIFDILISVLTEPKKIVWLVVAQIHIVALSINLFWLSELQVHVIPYWGTGIF